MLHTDPLPCLIPLLRFSIDFQMKFKIDKYEAFFFDFDGVIVDSVNIKTDAFAELYKPFGEEVISKVVSHHVSHGGMNRFEKFRYYHENFLNKKISESEVIELAQNFSALVVSKVLNAPFINGILEFLKLLKKENKEIFVISATPEDEIKRIIEKRRFDRYFDDIKGSPASKKENLKCLVENHRLDPSECLYFGDSEQDLDAASSLKITFIPINFHDKNIGYSDFEALMNTQKML